MKNNHIQTPINVMILDFSYESKEFEEAINHGILEQVKKHAIKKIERLPDFLPKDLFEVDIITEVTEDELKVIVKSYIRIKNELR